MLHKAAVIGTGFIGPVHVEALRRVGIEVVGILGSSPAKTVVAAETLQCPKAYESLDELLNDPSVDSVHVTSPNRFHFEQASKCLQAGKHVLCEKPLAMDATQSRQLVELARRCGLAAGVNYNIRYYPLCLEAAEQRKQGQLGQVFHVHGSYTQDWLFYQQDFNWRVSASEGGALRAVADIGTHWLDLVQAITGLEVEAVCADLQIVFPTRFRPVGGVETFSGKQTREQQPDDLHPVEIDTEDSGCVLLRFQGGARGSLVVSQVVAGRKNCLKWEIAGSQKALGWDSERPNELWTGYRDRPNEVVARDPALMSPRAARHASYPAGHNEGFPDTFKQLFTDFYRSIDEESYLIEPPFPTFADGHREVVLCEAILRSANEQAWVSVERDGD